MSAHSLVQYYLLKQDLSYQDDDMCLNDVYRAAIIEGKLTFGALKRIFFRRMKREGKLICIYCQEPLKIYNTKERVMTGLAHNKLPKDMATIEHITPIADGGLKYVESNWACACSDCNNKRNRLPVFKVTDTKYIF